MFVYDGLSLQNRRPANMDSLLLSARSIGDRPVCIAAVCDGVGSMADGAFAASSAVQMLRNWFENLEDTKALGPQLREYMATVNLAIAMRARSRQMQTASTLSCLLAWDGRYCIVHVGDSRIYTLTEGVARQLTEDQVWDGKLTSALGRREETDIYCLEGTYTPGQPFLLCSDGLYKRLEPSVLTEALSRVNTGNVKNTLHQLAECVIARGETDNISAALLINKER